ncbi:MAG: SPOR domain-containing protein [Ignavibacteriales bacterium]|nr:SPOR domain-containing protein [Ignavibacteriales bacterium]
MNRAEIIQTLAIRAGMPQLEAGKFMEVFLRKLAALLVHGDAFFLQSFGSFEVVKPENVPASGEDSVIIYRPDGAYDNDEQLVFRVPVSSSETINPLDLYFSMGVNKPLIPLKGQKFVQDELPTSPLELRKFAEYKADTILGKGEIRRNAFGTEYDSIKKRYNQPVSGIDLTLQGEKQSNWEFGDDWKKEYEVETLLTGGSNEITDEFPLESAIKQENTGWDFGGDDDETPSGRDTADYEIPLQGLGGRSPFPPDAARTRELEIDMSEFADEEEEEGEDNIEQEAADFDSLFKKSLAENMLMAKPVEETDDIFSRVRSTREIPDIPGEDETSTPYDSAKFKSMIIDLKREDDNNDSFQAIGIRDTIERGPVKKESGAGKWYVLAFILVTIIGSLVYLKLYGIPLWAGKYISAKVDVVITKRVPVVIERDYAFPVTFPYKSMAAKPLQQPVGEPSALPPATLKDEKAAEEAMDRELQKIEEAKNKAAQEKKGKEVPQKTQPVQNEKIGEDASRQVQKYIFTDGSSFYVQVMSVKNKEVADAEVEQLGRRGFKAFAIAAVLPGKGTWYRVRVGSFSSSEEAARVALKLNLR